jgi:hypothetical protein
MLDYQIEVREDNVRVATDATMPVASAVVIPDGANPRLFHRRAMKLFPDGHQEHVAWLVMELDGVRVYFDGVSLVMTKQDLNP